MTLYTITEIFLFASRLASPLNDKSMHVSIGLKNTENRMLVFEDGMRSIYNDYICKIPEFVFAKDIPLNDILANYSDLSFKITLDVFERFNWKMSEDSKANLKKDQNKFLKGLA